MEIILSALNLFPQPYARKAEKIEQLTATVTSYHERLKDAKLAGHLTSTKSVEDIIKKGIAEIEFIVMTQPKPVI